MLADLITPVSIYLRIRDIYPNSLLLESSDYHGNENSYSFICMCPVAGFIVDKGIITENYPDGSIIRTAIKQKSEFASRLSSFTDSFEQTTNDTILPVNGLFGYTSYDSVQYFESVDIKSADQGLNVPEARYHMYRYIIAINHFLNTLRIIENKIDDSTSEIEKIESLLNSRNVAIYSFSAPGAEISEISDPEYREIVKKGKEHCFRGDVFQVVLSRKFSRKFMGDEFNVYRALRSVNPSPYLFYFDYGNYRIFGSSPEAHLKINSSIASINPIAGTFRRTGDDEKDKVLAQKLSEDKKENSEHVMLVDLARNDLSRYATNIRVDSFREVQFYSHVIHLVSSVSGDLKKGTTVADMMASTFPAGTLTGAPKVMAMKIIDRYEKHRRGFYGGAIGFIGLNGNFNHAIMIRTFLSTGNVLHYQAGAGIVAVSDEENELQEVNNKLGALRKAIELAEKVI